MAVSGLLEAKPGLSVGFPELLFHTDTTKHGEPSGRRKGMFLQCRPHRHPHPAQMSSQLPHDMQRGERMDGHPPESVGTLPCMWTHADEQVSKAVTGWPLTE